MRMRKRRSIMVCVEVGDEDVEGGEDEPLLVPVHAAARLCLGDNGLCATTTQCLLRPSRSDASPRSSRLASSPASRVTVEEANVGERARRCGMRTVWPVLVGTLLADCIPLNRRPASPQSRGRRARL